MFPVNDQKLIRKGALSSLKVAFQEFIGLGLPIDEIVELANTLLQGLIGTEDISRIFQQDPLV